MQNLTYIAFAFFIAVLISGCHQKKIDVSKSEDQVLNEIFKELTDSLVGFQVYPFPPPPGYNMDKYIHKNGITRREYYELIANIDTNRFVLSINDSVEPFIEIYRNYHSIFSDPSLSCYKTALNSYLSDKTHIKRLNLNKITNRGKYELSRSTHNPELIEKIKLGTFKYQYFGELTISKIYMSYSQNCGFLICELQCGFDCFNSHLVFIKRDVTHWKIDKIVLLALA